MHPSLPGPATPARRSDPIEDGFRTLPERYLGAERGFDATYEVRLGDIGRTWEIRCTEHGARVRKGVTKRTPDVVIGTDSEIWLRLREGELSGIEAFSQRTLYARGDWVMMAWELLQPVLDAWTSGDPRKFPNYEAGTWGPSEADTLIERSGRRWRRP